MRIKHGFMVFLSLIVLGVISFGMRLPSASALDSASVAIIGFYDYSDDCGQSQYLQLAASPSFTYEGVRISYELNYTGFTPDIGINVMVFADQYAIIVRDTYGTIIGSTSTIVAPDDPFEPLFGGEIYINDPFGSTLPPTGQPASRPWQFDIYDIRGGLPIALSPQQRLDNILTQPIVGTTIIDPIDLSAACESLPYLGETVNLNNGVGDLEAQLFEGRDIEGNPALNVYEVNNNGAGTFAFQITQDDIAPYVGNPPTSNTEILASASGKVVFYVLDTGEFQINIGPDENGEVFVMIFDAIPPDGIRSYTFNVYDILDD